MRHTGHRGGKPRHRLRRAALNSVRPEVHLLVRNTEALQGWTQFRPALSPKSFDHMSALARRLVSGYLFHAGSQINRYEPPSGAEFQRSIQNNVPIDKGDK